MGSKPAVTGTTHILPYSELSPADFERMCLWLALREGYEEAEHLGAAGNEQGRDILLRLEENQWAMQCKRVRRFGPTDAIKELDKIFSLDHSERPYGVIFVATCDISAETRKRAKARCANEIICEFISLTELDQRVKCHHDLVMEFFQLPHGQLDISPLFFMESFSDIISQALNEMRLFELIELLAALLCHDQAHNFAADDVRLKFSNLLRPALTEVAVTSLHFSDQDFRDYLMQEEEQSIESFQEYLQKQCRSRAASWVRTRLKEDLFHELFCDYYEAYQLFFIQDETELKSLQSRVGSKNGQALLAQLNDQLLLAKAAGTLVPRLQRSFSDEIVILLTSLQMTHEVIEKSHDSIDVVIFDVSGRFPTKVFVSATSRETDQDWIEMIEARRKNQSDLTHSFLVTDNRVGAEAERFASRRGFLIKRMTEFRELLQTTSSDEKYIFGRLATESLLSAIAVSDVYVEPKCEIVQPGFDSQQLSTATELARGQFEAFLNDSELKVFMVFGEYGVGKSAFLAQMAYKMCDPGARYRVVYVPLRKLEHGDQIPEVVGKAVTLAELYEGPAQRTCVVLDGLDEIPGAMQPDERRHNMLRIIEASRKAEKLVVSARSSYFRGLPEFWSLWSKDDDHPFWNKLTKHILPQGIRPAVRSIVLREFNYDDIDEYVAKFGAERGKGAEYTSLFHKRLKQFDPQGVYKRLARSPLYLSLLVNTEPWDDPSIDSIASVLKMLIEFWLARDTEKGPARWLLSPVDRMEFVYELAWFMYRQQKVQIPFSELDEFVTSLYGVEGKVDEAIALDLQTTGFLTTEGQGMQFCLPAFMDYLVAHRFARGEFPIAPPRLPTGGQGRIWLSLLEKGLTAADEWNDSKTDAWLNSLGIRFSDYDVPISTSPVGILYNVADEESFDWPVANSESHGKQRVVLNATFGQHTGVGERSIRVLYGSPMGLHCRPSAWITNQSLKWQAELPSRPKNAFVEFRHQGAKADPRSLLELVTIAVEGNVVFEIFYDHCTDDEFEQLLLAIGGHRATGKDYDWVMQVSGSAYE
ncbi:restriction endonuclease [uncultured Gimesia sp.]|uniref:restriction endonuclease n=1 Tax=uncultured Gimesia sp. TaxID=1678688 RepID=UPI0030D80679|tara:strand:- start:134432 stop:137554 length:3123 start_codon:yes stop_codon:yes gene_type:complete